MTFLIRPATPDDATAIAAIYAPYVEDHSVSFEEHAPSPIEMADRMAKVAAAGLPWLIAENDDWIVGFAYGRPFHERSAYRFAVETTIYVAEDRQREGVGRQLYMALIRTLAAQNYTQAIALIALPNEASLGMHESVGFQRAGVWRSVGYKQGEWRDVGLWQRQLALPEEPPEETLPFSTVGVVLS